MFAKKPAEEIQLDDAITSAVLNLTNHYPATPEYAAIVKQITKLNAVRTTTKPDRFSKDTLALVAGNLAGILVIVGHERAHIVTSKAIQFIGKFK